MSLANWKPRQVQGGLEDTYREQGWWTDDTLGRKLGEALRQNSHRRFRIWSDSRPWCGTVGSVAEAARAFAGAMSSRGIGGSDVIAFQLPNWAEAAVVFWGASLLGAIVVPIAHYYGPREVEFILRDSGAKIFVAPDTLPHRDLLPELESILKSVPSLELCAVVGERRARGTVAFSSLLDARNVPDQWSKVGADSPTLVAYTSGTTAYPKGVVHTHRTFLSELRQMQLTSRKAQAPPLTGAPVGHAGGMLGGLVLPLLRGVDIHLTDAWRPRIVLDAFDTAGVDFTGGSPYFLLSLLDSSELEPRHLIHMQRVGLGGAPIPKSVADRAGNLGILLTRMYGSTEHMTTTRTVIEDADEKRMYTDGRAMPGVEIRVADDGEVLSRGPDLFMGYTDASLTDLAVDEDGWYATGDIGTIDDEGYLTITERKKDLIIRGGENISAAEVEQLLERLNGVLEAIVVAGPDSRMGERVVAFVRLASNGPVPSLDDVRRYLGECGLGHQKWPEELYLVGEFERTPTGKVKKYKLRERLARERSLRS